MMVNNAHIYENNNSQLSDVLDQQLVLYLWRKRESSRDRDRWRQRWIKTDTAMFLL